MKILTALLPVVCVCLWSCSGKHKAAPVSQNQEQQTVAKPVKKAPAKKQLTRSGYIHDDNVVKILTEFGRKNPETEITVKTTKGTIRIRLYEDTPLHRANFLMLIKDGYFDDTVFYRVVPGLVIQGGDSDDTGKRAWKKKIGVYTIPEEVRPAHIHKKGALAMSRYYENNPTKRSSSWDFYIVQGAMPSEAALRTIPEANHETYKKVGGTWHLDGQHTVFGEVIDGFDVIDKIAAVRCDSGDWPYTDVVIHMVVNK